MLAPRRAAVAVVLRERQQAVEVLLIQRARHPRDPWSGHMAFPGGRADPKDRDLEATALRETREEVGLDLRANATLLGRLSDERAMARGRRLPMAITPVVFELHLEAPRLEVNQEEVTSTHWIPLEALRSGEHDSKLTWWVYRFIPLRLGCWRYEGLVIWGLTYRMLGKLLAFT
ncbi:NUDIX hydrolase [Planctomycetota bacterium]